MKLFHLSLPLLFVAGLANAQSVNEGEQQLYYERYGSAEATFHQLLQQQPAQEAAWLGLSKAYIGQNKVQKGLDTLRLAPPSVTGTPLYKVAYGSLLLNNNQKDSAAYFFTAALQQTREKNPAVLAAIATAHTEIKGGDAAYAVSLLQKAIKRDKRNAQLHVVMGDAYRRLQNGSESYQAYQEAIRRDSKNAAAYTRLGDIFQTQKNAEMYLEYYNKAVSADDNYAPALYRLYLHYFYHDPAQAKNYYNAYAAKADASLQTEYDLTDLYYLTKEYDKAIEKANALVASQGSAVAPRIYKLLGYSYAGIKDSTQAVAAMERYFQKEADTNIIAKDYIAMADLYASFKNLDSAVAYYEKAAGIEKDSVALYGYYKKLADYSGAAKNFSAQAKWLGKYYSNNPKASNVDLFNWGLAHFRAEEYTLADSAFGKYTAEYPTQGFGHYWRAKSNAALDTDMAQGIAVPHYEKLIEVLKDDTANTSYQKWMVEAYGYLAAYETNAKKNFAEAVAYFEKLLEVDPGNADAKRYIEILEKRINAQGKN